MSRTTGTVKWFDDNKGYGFLSSDQYEEDIFVHYSEIQGSEQFKNLNEGQRVEFEPKDTDDGIQAEEVLQLTNA